MRIITDITNYIFIEDAPEKADIIFIPSGSNPETAERAAEREQDSRKQTV